MDLLEHCQTKGYSPAQIGPAVARGMPFLDPPEKKLLEMVLSGRLSRREIAALTGVPVQTVSRRLLRLLARLHDPLVTALIEHGQLLPELHREVGLAYFLRRRPVRRIGADYRLTQYQVRRILTYING